MLITIMEIFSMGHISPSQKMDFTAFTHTALQQAAMDRFIFTSTATNTFGQPGDHPIATAGSLILIRHWSSWRTLKSMSGSTANWITWMIPWRHMLKEEWLPDLNEWKNFLNTLHNKEHISKYVFSAFLLTSSSFNKRSYIKIRDRLIEFRKKNIFLPFRVSGTLKPVEYAGKNRFL